MLLFSLSLQCFSKLGVLINYEINKDYIASVLCVNRDKPEMHCEGQCYLRKQLHRDEQHKQQDNGITGNKIEIALFCATDLHFFTFDLRTDKCAFSPVLIPHYQSPYFHIFHPPRFA